MEYPDDCELSFVHSGANNPKYSWNKVVKDFLETDGDWLWSCHSDVAFLPETLPRLLSWDKPLVSALVFMRGGPTLPHIWRSYSDEHKLYAMRVMDTKNFYWRHPESIKWGPQVMQPRPDDALAEIDFTSTSCTLIHRKVLEAIKVKYNEEWFLMDNDYSGGGEDRRFFERAREVGYPAYVDRSCIAGHLAGDIPMGVMDFMAWESVSNFLGTGEPGGFNIDKIKWSRGGYALPGTPVSLFDEANAKFLNGEVTIGGGKLDPDFVPLGQWID